MPKKVPKYTTYNISFTVFPKDTNYMYPMVFGGKILAEMDICAAGAARRALYDSECVDAVTVGVYDVKFYKGAVVKDIIFLDAEIIKFGIKSIRIHVSGTVEEPTGKRYNVCDGDFVFVSRNDKGEPMPHNLMLGEKDAR